MHHPTALVAATTALALAGVGLAGCSDGGDRPDTRGTVDTQPGTGPPGGTDGPGTTSGPDTSVPGTGDPGGSGGAVLTEVATLGTLTAMAVDPATGTAFAAEREGRVQVVDLASGQVTGPVVDLSDETSTDGERGLLGLAVDPDGTHLYLSYTNRDGHTRVDQMAIDGADVDVDSRRELFAIDQPYPNHNGGHIAFGPDGRLYLGLGDGGAGGDPLGAGQDPDNLLGKLLVLDPGGGDAEIFLWGVRNPWRFSWDRETGDLWLADVGQDTTEEVNRLAADEGGGAGANLGWNEMEGDQPFEDGTEPADHTPPVYTYGRDDGCSVTGGYVYRGQALASLQGVYVFGDYCTSALWGLRSTEGGEMERIDLGLDLGDGELVSFGEDLDGELYVLTWAGTLYRLDAG